jgi:hypothetical protein
MAGIPFKGGFKPVNNDGSTGAYTAGFRTFQTSATSGAIFNGDPVFLLADGTVAAGETPTATTNCIGVAIGTFFIDPITDQPVDTDVKLANQVSAAGEYNGILFTAGAGPGIKVALGGQGQLFAVKASVAIPQTALGDRLALVTTTAGSTITGQSGATISAAADVNSPVMVADVLRTNEYGTPSDAGGATRNDFGSPETVVLVELRNVGL